MVYKYNTHNGMVRAYISFESYNDSVSVFDGNDSEYKTKLYNREDGELAFNYRGEEVLFKSFIKSSMKEIKSKGNSLFDNEIMTAIICDGIDNVRFEMELPIPDAVITPIGIAIHSDKTARFKCRLAKEYNYMPHNNYKLKFVAVNTESEDEELVYNQSMYVSSFVSFIKKGKITILDSIDDGKTVYERVFEYFNTITSSEHFDYKMSV